MTLPTLDQARRWRGLTLVAEDDEPVGKIEAIYVDRSTRQPEWALVHTGLFGSARTFVPLADAAQRGDTVRVPHATSVVHEAPRLEEDAELSEEDEARLCAHYGIQYATDASSSGLPAGETAAATATPSDATAELSPASRFEADAPAAAGTTRPTPPAGTSWSGDTTGAALGDAGANGGRGQAAAGIGVFALSAVGAGAVSLRRRLRKPPTLGERVGQVGRETADAITRAAEEVRQTVAATGGEGAKKAAEGGRRATRKARREAARAGTEAAEAGRRAAAAAAAAGLAAAAGTSRAARKAAKQAAKSGQQAAEGGRKAASKAAASGTAAAAEGRRAAKRARYEAAAVVAAIETTPEAKRRARRRRRARKQAAAAVAGTAKTVASAPAAAGRKVKQADAGKRTGKSTPRRQRRSKMKMRGKLGMVVGAAVGYVLGAKAGRERYDQLAASARQLLDQPQVKRVMDSVPGDLGARVEQAANKAADKVQQAGEKVAGESGTSGATAGTTTTTSTATSPSVPSTPSTSGAGDR